MKNLILKFLYSGWLLAVANISCAQDWDARTLRLINPSQSIDIHLGDVLTRHLELEVKQPYQISKNAFPVKGVSRNGIELRDISVASEQHDDITVYKIDFYYQVFAHTPNPSVMSLPAEELVITGSSNETSIKLPAWQFWFSPLGSVSIDQAKENMQPQQKATLVEFSRHQTGLAIFTAIAAISLFILVYINADTNWLPFMGGAFAIAHRQLRKYSETSGDGKPALVALHQAFNQTYGQNLFVQDIDAFFKAHPRFTKLRNEIIHFFDHSNQRLFAKGEHQDSQLIKQVVLLSRKLRDCERGV